MLIYFGNITYKPFLNCLTDTSHDETSMKILLINKYHYMRGGAERAYFDMAKILAEAGHEVAFFSMEHPLNRETSWSRYFVSGVEYDEHLPQSIYSKLRAVFRIWWNREAQRKLDALIDDFQPDVAHLHNIYHQLSPSIVWTLHARSIPVAMTVHDYKFICPNYSLFSDGALWEKSKPKKYVRCIGDRCVKHSYAKSIVCTIEAYMHQWIRSYAHVAVFIAPSHFLIQKFREFEWEYPLRYIAQPIVTDASEKTSVLSVSVASDAPFVFFGRLSEEKGVDIAIAAMKQYAGTSPLHIIGSGPQESALRSLVNELGLQDRVTFLGAQYDDVLTASIQTAKAIIVPSIWYENMPYALTEALSLGKVVIASRIGGMTEQIIDGENGFLCEAGNAKELSIKMTEIDHLSQERWQSIGDQAKARIASYTTQNYRAQLEALYKEIIEQKTKVSTSEKTSA